MISWHAVCDIWDKARKNEPSALFGRTFIGAFPAHLIQQENDNEQ